ncbi:MAG: protein translocase subunit SecD, partial [bacterium]
ARKFARFTEENLNKFLCIVLDKTVMSCPVIRSAITQGQGVIEGNFTQQDVEDMVAVLNSGRLPARVKVVSELSVSPYLGKSSIEASVRAFLLGAVLILIFMVAFYRAMGIVADIALFYYFFLTMGVLISLDAALTIYGVAGLVLSLGMAVDANVLIFSRIWDEYARGKTLLQAMEDGHKNALSAIIDSNVTTLIAAGVLYLFGNPTLKGFATTLSIGIGASMFSALFFAHTLLEALVRLTKNPAYYGIRYREAG